MGRKRKRQHHSHERDQLKQKRARHQDYESGRANAVGQRLLPHYYPQVQTLGEYLERRLKASSKFDRHLSELDGDDDVYRLLKTTLVGSFQATQTDQRAIWSRDFQDFTQRRGDSVDGSRRTSGGLPSSLEDGTVAMSELVDFAIWSLFARIHRHKKAPPHVLCNGFQRADHLAKTPTASTIGCTIDGLVALRANAQVDRMRGTEWCQLLQMLGSERDQVMVELIFNCGIFVPLKAGMDNFLQLSGTNIAELPLLDKNGATNMVLQQVAGAQPDQAKPADTRLASSITFVRNRMFYARAALHGKGEVHMGFRQIHVLNRCSDIADDQQTVHIMKYIFPRQFGLHNVFVSQVEKKETAYRFQDYSLRESEIAAAGSRQSKAKLPRRLRGECFHLVRKMRVLHGQCAYKELLKHYCVVPEFDRAYKVGRRRRGIKTKQNLASSYDDRYALSEDGAKKHLTDLACPTAHVSAFVRAVIKSLVPTGFLGMGERSDDNWKSLLRCVDQFIDGKRFENISLAAVCQGIKIKHIAWLQPPSMTEGTRISQSDYLKRMELLQELLYYLFDSLIIPMVRSCFYVTESSEHRNRLFYFRHDVWRTVSEPAMTRIKSSIYHDLPAATVQSILQRRLLGYSNLRLLPKKATARPITNLKRKAVIKRGGKQHLGASINATLKNAFSMLNYEKLCQPELLGSAMFSNNELYPRLVGFKDKLIANGLSDEPLYFVKVDVQACFDTIPQEALMQLIEGICQRERLVVKHHAQIKAPPFSKDSSVMNLPNSNPSRKFRANAHAQLMSQSSSFPETVEDRYAQDKRGTVFVEGSMQSYLESEDLLDMLDDHVKRNIVRIGKKYFRQKSGIAQGSVVSSILCSFFYGDFEQKRLSFLRNGADPDRGAQNVLLRLIDDFLLITTQQATAERFLRIMLAGDPEYGVSVRPEKTLVNFKPASLPPMHGLTVSDPTSKFPWCGMWIDPSTLSLTRDRTKRAGAEGGRATSLRRRKKGNGRRVGTDLADLTTVEAVRRPGAMFYHKTMSAVKMNVRNMYTDTSMASPEQVENELMSGFCEAAQKAVRYLSRLRALARGREIRDEVVKRTIEDVGKLASVLTRNRQNGAGMADRYRCDVGRKRIELLVTRAFMQSLRGQQTRYRSILVWLRDREAALS